MAASEAADVTSLEPNNITLEAATSPHFSSETWPLLLHLSFLMVAKEQRSVLPSSRLNWDCEFSMSEAWGALLPCICWNSLIIFLLLFFLISARSLGRLTRTSSQVRPYCAAAMQTKGDNFLSLYAMKTTFVRRALSNIRFVCFSVLILFHFHACSLYKIIFLHVCSVLLDVWGNSKYHFPKTSWTAGVRKEMAWFVYLNYWHGLRIPQIAKSGKSLQWKWFQWNQYFRQLILLNS